MKREGQEEGRQFRIEKEKGTVYDRINKFNKININIEIIKI